MIQLSSPRSIPKNYSSTSSSVFWFPRCTSSSSLLYNPLNGIIKLFWTDRLYFLDTCLVRWIEHKVRCGELCFRWRLFHPSRLEGRQLFVVRAWARWPARTSLNRFWLCMSISSMDWKRSSELSCEGSLLRNWAIWMKSNCRSTSS